MKQLQLLAATAALVSLAACGDNTPTQPTGRTAPTGVQTVRSAATPSATTSLVTSVTGTVTNALSQVGTFTGTEQITSFATNSAGQLAANVLVTGQAVIGGVTTPISQTVTTLASTTGTCPVLTLDLGAIHLDVLGLVVDLSAVALNVTAQSGPGNLLGNLLCAVVHLLDGSGSSTAVSNLLGLLNNLL